MPRDILSLKQVQFINWLVTPPSEREPNEQTQNQWAKAHGVSTSLPAQWKRLNKTFQRELKAKFRELNMDPGRVQEVIDALHRQAAMGDVKAGIFYLSFVGDWTPTEKRIIETNKASDLSNEELLSEIESEADRLRCELSMAEADAER